MAPTSSARPTWSGRYRIVATSVARFTTASSTPGVRFRNRSIRFTHDAQVMPSTGRASSAVVASVVLCILPRSIRREPPATAGPILWQVIGTTVVTAAFAAPWGPLRLAATDGGLVAVEQLTSAEEFTARLQRRFGVPPIDMDGAPAGSPAVGHLEAGRRALEAFVAGDLGALDNLPIDMDDRPGWDRLVL